MLKVLPILIFPCELMNPTTRGMLERWQGLKIMLKTPQLKEARTASQTVPVIASYSDVNKLSNMGLLQVYAIEV
jgi:hypothetical protein